MTSYPSHNRDYTVPISSTTELHLNDLTSPLPSCIGTQPHLYSPSQSREASPSSTTSGSAAPEIRPAQLPSFKDAYTQTTPPSAPNPIHRSTGNQRCAPYTSLVPKTTTSEKMSPKYSGHLSAVALNRLATPGVCKIDQCRETFTSADDFRYHVWQSHEIRQGKNGPEILPCPWEGCKLSRTKGALYNHVLAHTIKNGCRLCDGITTARSDSVQKHYRCCHRETYRHVSVLSSKVEDYAYLFFEK